MWRRSLVLLMLSAAGCTPAWGAIEDLDYPEDQPAGDAGKPRPGKDTGTRPGSDGDPSPDPGDGAAPKDPDPPPPEPDNPLVKSLDITEVAMFQGVKISIAKGGAKVSKRNASVIANREGTLRVYVSPAAGWEAREVTGKLVISSGSGAPVTIKSTPVTLSAASTDASLSSTVNFEIPTDAIAPDASYVVSLHTAPGQPGSGSTANAKYPASGTPESLDAMSTGSVFKVTIVPVKYGADGSNRLPDISDAQKELYRQVAYSFYPARKVEITFRAPYDWSRGIYNDGSGFDELLSAMVKLRQSDGAPKDVYYYGAFAAASSFSSYCSGGCVTGLCGLSDDPSDSVVRACVGVGFTGRYSAETMAHEVGHASGRYHAPCGGAAGADPSYPYSGAKIGAWGFDLVAKKLIDPTKTVDFMSYCSPVFISDFNYQALAKRMAYVSGGKSIFTPPGAPTKYRMVKVGGDGALTWGESIDVGETLLSDPRTVTFEDETGRVLSTATGHFYPYDHLPGGYLLVPEGPSGFSSLTVRSPLGGELTRLARP